MAEETWAKAKIIHKNMRSSLSNNDLFCALKWECNGFPPPQHHWPFVLLFKISPSNSRLNSTFSWQRKRRWHLYRHAREVKCGVLTREGPPKNPFETETCRFPPHSGVCDWCQPQTSDQTMRAKAVDSSTHVCKKNISHLNLVPNVFIKTSYLAFHTHLGTVNVNSNT